MDAEEIRTALGRLRDILITVSTGGARIGEVNDDYRQLFDDVDSSLARIAIENTIPYRDLWQWYGRWSSGDLPSYQSRRVHVAELIDPMVKSLRPDANERPKALTGWPKVDRTIAKARIDIATAQNEEEFQLIGTLCREALISLAQAVFDQTKHPVDDVPRVSATDFKRMIEGFIAAELGGGSADEQRKHARAAFDLANNLQHRRTANFRLAAMCLEATTSVVNIIAIASGRRDPA